MEREHLWTQDLAHKATLAHFTQLVKLDLGLELRPLTTSLVLLNPQCLAHDLYTFGIKGMVIELINEFITDIWFENGLAKVTLELITI